MTKKNLKSLSIALFLFLLVSLLAFPQQEYKPPETILPGEIIKIILNEISGQLAFNNEVMLAGYNHIRTGEEELKHVTPAKVEPIPLVKWIPFSTLFRAIRKDTQLSSKIFRQYGHLFLMELYLCIDGKRTLPQIRDLLSFEFQPINTEDFMKVINLLEGEKLIKIKK